MAIDFVVVTCGDPGGRGADAEDGEDDHTQPAQLLAEAMAATAQNSDEEYWYEVDQFNDSENVSTTKDWSAHFAIRRSCS